MLRGHESLLGLCTVVGFDITGTETLVSRERVILQLDVGSVTFTVKNTNTSSYLFSLVITHVNILNYIIII
jgi:hypothetical protein